MTTFEEAVYAVVRKIPEGSVMTYKQVAHAVKRPRAYRAVGSALKKNYDPDIPCHRVVRSDLDLGNYNRGRSNKRHLLIKEGYLNA